MANDTATDPTRPVAVGDIFSASWGYDQTNVDHYKVVKVTETGARFRKIGTKVVGNDRVAPDPEVELDEQFFRRIVLTRGKPGASFRKSYGWLSRISATTDQYATIHGMGH
jgi:hypothetical protein